MQRGSRLLCFLLGLVIPVLACAQPHIGYVYPAGGKIGSTFYVVVGGQYLNNASNPVVTGPGIDAQFVEFNSPLPQKEFNDLRDKWRELTDRRRDHYQNKRTTNTWTAADDQTLEELRVKILKNPPNRSASPAIADTVTLKISIATNASPGDGEIRLATPNGLSNPLRFCVGELPEFSQPAVRAPNPDLDKFLERLGRPPRTNSARAAMRVTLPAVVNGQISPGAVDRFRFTARKGQRIIATVSARDLIPYLADAVPGWFQAAVSISNTKGHELAYDDHYRFHPDPVLCCEIPRDGEYILQIRDSIYRGREDFVYRIRIGELPFVTSVFPLGGKVGEQTQIALSGWNLPVTNVTVNCSNEVPGIQEIPVGTDDSIVASIPFAMDDLPEVAERAANDTVRNAQSVTLPVIVNGRVEKSGDADVFSFDGKADQEVVAEVTARRLDSPLDSTLELLDTKGRRLAFNDDIEDKGAGLETHHADSYLRARLPADGTYFIRLTDAQSHGGPEFGYRLRMSAPQPDFALRIVPSSISVRAGGSALLTAYAVRRDDFTNAISFWLKDAPKGFLLSGATIPAGQNEVRFTLAAPAARQNAPVQLEIEGHATMNGAAVIHRAIPADDMMQAFAYRHLVPAKTLQVIVGGQGVRAPMKIVGPVLRIPIGGKATAHVTASGSGLADRLSFELSEPPEGISLGKISPLADGVALEVRADEKAKAGTAGNLIVDAQPKRPGNAPAAAGARRAPANVLPAIPFEIISGLPAE